LITHTGARAHMHVGRMCCIPTHQDAFLHGTALAHSEDDQRHQRHQQQASPCAQGLAWLMQHQYKHAWKWTRHARQRRSKLALMLSICAKAVLQQPIWPCPAACQPAYINQTMVSQLANLAMASKHDQNYGPCTAQHPREQHCTAGEVQRLQAAALMPCSTPWGSIVVIPLPSPQRLLPRSAPPCLLRSFYQRQLSPTWAAQVHYLMLVIRYLAASSLVDMHKQPHT